MTFCPCEGSPRSFVHTVWHVFEVNQYIWHLLCRTFTHWGRDKMTAIFLTTFSNTFSWIGPINNIPALVYRRIYASFCLNESKVFQISAPSIKKDIQYIPRNMYTVFALLCFVVVIHWLIFPYPSGLLHWHCGNLTIAPVPAKQPWWIWINTSCEFIMNDCITTTKQSTTKPCAYFLGYTVESTRMKQLRRITYTLFMAKSPALCWL